jgi:hypothetical protein
VCPNKVSIRKCTRFTSFIFPTFQVSSRTGRRSSVVGPNFQQPPGLGWAWQHSYISRSSSQVLEIFEHTESGRGYMAKIVPHRMHCSKCYLCIYLGTGIRASEVIDDDYKWRSRTPFLWTYNGCRMRSGMVLPG